MPTYIHSDKKLFYDVTYRQLTDERIHKALYEYLEMLDGIKHLYGEIHVIDGNEKRVKINKDNLETRISRIHRLISEVNRLGERSYFEIVDEKEVKNSI